MVIGRIIALLGGLAALALAIDYGRSGDRAGVLIAGGFFVIVVVLDRLNWSRHRPTVSPAFDEHRQP